MPFPAGLQLVTVNGHYGAPAGTAAGRVRFEAPYPLLGPADDSIVAPFTLFANLDDNGDFTIELPATNDPGWTPVDWAYQVRAIVGGATIPGTLQLDYQTTTVEFADLFQVDGAAEQGVTYATLAQLQALTGADLDIEIEDVDDLQTQLDGKQPAGTYLEPDDITNLVSYETLNEALVLKANLASPTFTGTVAGITKSMVGLGSVDNTSDAAKPVSTATQTALDLVSAGVVRATDHGLVGWTFDPTGVQAGTAQPTAGLAQVARVRALSATVTNILLHATAGGSSLTSGQCFAALYTDAGALLAVTADQATAWATGGLKTCALTAPQAVTAGAWYRVLWWFNGTTGPTWSRGVNSSSAILNVGLSSPNFRYSTANSGLTTSAPANIGTQTGGATAWWVGVS